MDWVQTCGWHLVPCWIQKLVQLLWLNSTVATLLKDILGWHQGMLRLMLAYATQIELMPWQVPGVVAKQRRPLAPCCL